MVTVEAAAFDNGAGSVTLPAVAPFWNRLSPQPSVRDVRLDTTRLILREYRVDDAEAVLAYAADPEALRYRQAQPASRDDVVASLQRIDSHRRQDPQRLRYELAVVTRADDRVVGWLPLLLSGDPEQNDAEIGWTLARDSWGHGIATEAAEATLAFAFETLGLHRVWARCQPANLASERIMFKLGMRREGLFLKTRFVKGRWVDSLHYAILDEEWWTKRRGSIITPQDN